MRVRIIIILLAVPLFAAGQNFGDQIQTDLVQYYEKHLQIKTSVTFNQPSYSPGDTVFYKVHIVSAHGLKPVRARSVMTVIVRGPDTRPVLKHHIPVTNGLSYNDYKIPDDAIPGEYKMIVYNRLMLNGPQELIYEKAFRVSVDATDESSLEIFLTGDYLLAGIENRVTFRGAANISCAVVSDAGHHSAVTIDDDGEAQLILKPELGHQYAITYNNRKIDLPEVRPDGCTLDVIERQDEFRVVIAAPLTSMHLNTTLHLILSNQALVYYAADIKLKKQAVAIATISKADLRPGVSQLTLFDNNKKMVANRLISIPPDPMEAEVSLDKTVYEPRDLVALNVSLPSSSNLSATVYHQGLTGSFKKSGIVNDLLKYNDLGFRVRDGLMSGQAFRRYNWNSLGDSVPLNFLYDENLYFTGRASFENGGLVPDSTRISFFLQRTGVTYQSYAITGNFDVVMPMDIYGEEEVFFKADHRNIVLKNVVIKVDDYSLSTKIPEGTASTIKNQYHEFARTRSVVTSAYSHYARETKDHQSRRLLSIEDEFGTADVEVRLRDYLLFPDMIETLREVVPLVQHREVKGEDVVRIYDAEQDLFPNGTPVFIIDGVMTDDQAFFLKLDPAKVLTIKVIYSTRKLRHFGPLGNGGIIIVNTAIPGNEKNVPRSKYTFVISGFHKPSRVSTFVPEDRVPDLRSNLLWKPAVRVEANKRQTLKFYASDMPGIYELRIEGLTDDGVPFEFQKTFEVKFTGVRK